LDLRDHVTRNEAETGAGLPSVEPVCIFIPIDLESREKPKHCDWLVQKYISPTCSSQVQSKTPLSQVSVADACHPSYSGGRDQEDHSSKPAQANSSEDPITEKPITKDWAGGVARDEGPEFKPQYSKKKKNPTTTTSKKPLN
jgi:hypothetical protein